MILFETNSELESQRLELHQVYQWADQAHREDQCMWTTRNWKLTFQ